MNYINVKPGAGNWNSRLRAEGRWGEFSVCTVAKRTIARRGEQRKLKATEGVWEEKRTGPVEPTKRLLSIFHDGSDNDDHREVSSLSVRSSSSSFSSGCLRRVTKDLYAEAAWR